jgi:hypothetical protein
MRDISLNWEISPILKRYLCKIGDISIILRLLINSIFRINSKRACHS